MVTIVTRLYPRAPPPVKPGPRWISRSLSPTGGEGRVRGGQLAGLQRFGNGLHVVDAAAPGAAACLLEGRPESRVVRQVGIRREIGARRAAGQGARAFVRAEELLAVADQVDAALEAIAVDDDLDDVALEHLADRPARERLGSHVTDTGARRDAREARVRQDGDLLAIGQMP